MSDQREQAINPCARKACRYHKQWMAVNHDYLPARAILPGKVEGDQTTSFQQAIAWCLSCKHFRRADNYRKQGEES